jgi:hypothetical protein
VLSAALPRVRWPVFFVQPKTLLGDVLAFL